MLMLTRLTLILSILFNRLIMEHLIYAWGNIAEVTDYSAYGKTHSEREAAQATEEAKSTVSKGYGVKLCLFCKKGIELYDRYI